jgi:hypothetical protein
LVRHEAWEEREREALKLEHENRRRKWNRITLVTRLAKAAAFGAIIGLGYVAVSHTDLSPIALGLAAWLRAFT